MTVSDLKMTVWHGNFNKIVKTGHKGHHLNFNFNHEFI